MSFTFNSKKEHLSSRIFHVKPINEDADKEENEKKAPVEDPPFSKYCQATR